MKRVRKYTYLPQEEIEVIETKSGETIKSKEILDGNYIKAKPTPKKVVKKVVKKAVKKYANGGRIKVGTFNEEQLINKEDKKAVEKAREESGLKYVDTKIIKKGGKMYMEVYLIPNEEYYNSSKFAKGGTINMNKHIWEGWTVSDFIESLDIEFKYHPKFKSRDEVKKWAMENQPYYKKYIPDVVDYYWQKNEEKMNRGNGFEYYANGGMAEGGMMAEGGRVGSQYIVTYDDGDDISRVWVYANNEQDAKEQALEEYSDIKDIISVEKMMADGGMMAKGGYTSKGELVWRKLSASKKSEFLYENFTPQITPRGQEILVGKDFQFLPKNVKIKLQEKYANVEEYGDGGKVTDKEVADSNVEMLHSNIKSIKHHAEELENAVKDSSIEVEGWVLAKADRAATAMSDITHYLDGRKMGNGGMVVGYYYNDKNGENLRYVGSDSRDEKMGIFKSGDKYIQKPYNDFEQEPKNNKLFGFFGNGGYMPKGTSRKLTVAEKAEEMVGRNTWKTLDAAEKAGVIGELISDGALAITMEGGGIVDENDWNASSTDEKIYALKKAGYSNNMASELSLLPYEQVPMWVREDFRKGVIVIGDYHIHKNRMSSPIPLDMGYVLVLNGDEEVVFSAKTLEEAKEWATEQVRLEEEESEDYEMVSDCCGAPQGEITDLCPECREHCGWEKMYYAEGGVTEAVRFKVIYKIKDAEPKEKIFDNAENAEFFLETIKEDDDIESANLVEVKPEKKAVEKKVTNLFAAAKPAAATSASKKGKEDVFVNGIADEIARYDALKAIIKNAEAEQGVIGDRLKEVGVDKFLELYELRRRNPDTFNLADEDKKIMFIVMDKYKKVEPEKAEMLANYEGLLETITTYKFNPELLDRTGEIVSRLIIESSELSDDEKANLIIAETKTQIQKGAIDRLLDYDNPSQIFTLIEPILALK
jgi:hypothetical protein